MYGGVLDVELKVKKLKLQDIIYIDDLILLRKYKNIWKIMNDEYFFDFLLFFVNIDKSFCCKKVELVKKIEVKDKKFRKFVELEEQNLIIDNYLSVEQQNNVVVLSVIVVIFSVIVFIFSVIVFIFSVFVFILSLIFVILSVVDIEFIVESQNLSLLKEFVLKRLYKKKIYFLKLSKDLNSEVKVKKKLDLVFLIDFERVIFELKKKYKKYKRKISVVESGKEININDCEDKSKLIYKNEKDLKDKKGKVGNDKEIIVLKFKIVQKIFREKVKEEEMENMKFVFVMGELFFFFEEIL